MATKLRGTDLVKLDTLGEARRKWDRVRKLIEQAAVTPKAEDDLMRQASRTSSEVGRFLTNAGFGAVAGYPNDLGALLRRTATLQSKLGAIRDMIAQCYTAFDRAHRTIEEQA